MFAILQRVGLLSVSSVPPPLLPYRPAVSLLNARFTEGVRPLYWLLRPRAYQANSGRCAPLPPAAQPPARG